MIVPNQAYAIIRVDELSGANVSVQDRITVQKVVWAMETAKYEVERLNSANSDPECFYFWQYTEVDPHIITDAVGQAIQAYLSSRDHPQDVPNWGLPRLLYKWQFVVRGLTQGDPGYVYYYEFLNDMDARRLLRECLELLSPEQREPFVERVLRLDERFREATVETDTCIWGKEKGIIYLTPSPKFGILPPDKERGLPI